MSARRETSLPTLANANLLCAAIEAFDPKLEAKYVAESVLQLAQLTEEIDVEETLRDVNEDRAISGFPEIKSADLVESELRERRRHFRDAIKQTLNRMAPQNLVKVMTIAVTTATGQGGSHAPELIDELVDTYEVETQQFLQTEAENLRKLAKGTLAAAKAGEAQVGALIERIEGVARNWQAVALPIQISRKARGMQHDLSHDVALELRSLAVDLFNEHDMLPHAQRLTQLLKALFSSVPEVIERIQEDEKTLGEIEAKRSAELLRQPISELCASAEKAVDSDPESGEMEGRRVLSTADQLLANLRKRCEQDQIVDEASDRIAVTIMHCAVAFANKTNKFEAATALLESAQARSRSAGVREQIEKNLAISRKNASRYGNLEPISSAPSLRSVNGIGFTLYGRSDFDAESRSYMSTYYFVFFGIPVFPIHRYRVIPMEGGYRFLGKAPLRTFDKWHIAISSLVLIWLAFQMK